MNRTENVLLPGFDGDGIGDYVTVIEAEDFLRIETDEWITKDCTPFRLEVDQFAVTECGGKENVLKAFAAFTRELDKNWPE